jgi:hypothetical protein
MSGKVLRGLGIALIAMPDPFTTPLGVGLLAASWALSRHQETQRKKYVRHLVTEYLHTYRPFGYGMGSETKTSLNLPYREPQPLYHAAGAEAHRSMDHTIPVYSRPDNEKVVYHPFDLGRASKRFDKGGSKQGFEGFWGRQSKLDIGVVYHNLRTAACLS